MTRVARIEQFGGPDVIQWVDETVGDPRPGELKVRATAVGLNFIDTYHRSGLYKIDLPSGLGTEGVGVVEAVGGGVTRFRAGDRIGTFGGRLGAYAIERLVEAAQAVHIPDDVDDRTAAALLLKGGTAQFLVERCARVQAGETVLVHAAAGGVGQLLVGWLKAVGATVIGTVGSADKAERARAAGADHVIEYREQDIVARVREITGGKGVRVSFDGVGKATWAASLDSVGPRGLIVSFGNASGPVTDVALGTLASHGSLFVTRPTMVHYFTTPEERETGIARVFEMLRRGAIKPNIGQTYALEDVADAHRALQAGETHGATVLMPF